MGVNESGAVETPLPFVSAELDQMLRAVASSHGLSPMARAVQIADTLDSALMRAALLPRIGDVAGSIYWHRQAVTQPGPHQRAVFESLIQMIDRDIHTTPAEARAIREEWWQRYGAAIHPQPPIGVDWTPERPLRVGYVSSNFKHSSAGNCLEALVLRHSEAVQVICYSGQPVSRTDPISWMFDALTQHVDISRLTDAEFAARVRADRIDILVDCMGFTLGNRLTAFCERPAPIQLTGWGYATGTIPAMDGLVLDAITAGTDQFFERVVHAPCVLTFAPPAMFCPDVAPPPTGPVTFGAYHCFIKINDDVLAVWRRILDRVPESRIVFKGDEYREALLQQRIQTALGGRAEFWPRTQQLEHFAAFRHTDLVLDPWPQTGGITTCEALHMGVPSVTWMGPRTIQRAAASILDAVGFHQGIATSADAYVDRAVDLVTTQRAWLGTQRPLWRERLRTSRVCSHYVPAVEQVYRDLWRAACAQGSPSRSH